MKNELNDLLDAIASDYKEWAAAIVGLTLIGTAGTNWK